MDAKSSIKIKRCKEQVRQLAKAFVTLPGAHRTDTRRQNAATIARLAVAMATGVVWRDVTVDVLHSLISYAETSLATYAEGGE